MTLAALMLRDRYFAQSVSQCLKYATLAVLLVNVSIGGVLTPYAALPVLMVASKWNLGYQFHAALLRLESGDGGLHQCAGRDTAVPTDTCCIAFAGVDARRPANADDGRGGASAFSAGGRLLQSPFCIVFMGLSLLFPRLHGGYPRHQDPLMLREGLLVAFFLAGLVLLGGQKWWLQPLLAGMQSDTLF